MDPITALGVASTAYKAIVTGFKVGKQVESMSKDLGRWMGAIQDIKDGHKKKSSGKTFGSVEEESLETFAALKKAEQMENELRTFINFEYGPNAWNEVIRIQADIRIKKKEAEEEAKRKQKQMIENTILGGIAIFFLVFVVYIALLVINT
jgi:molecular chaperone GrpE (heat shock protein)|tara:strand:+ start:23 stop:472 length:450 start_codon:yes stop_codon:yes gene_type:complete